MVLLAALCHRRSREFGSSAALRSGPNSAAGAYTRAEGDCAGAACSPTILRIDLRVAPIAICSYLARPFPPLKKAGVCPAPFQPPAARAGTLNPGLSFAGRAQGMEAMMSVMLFWGVGFAALIWLAFEIVAEWEDD
jgi:hypothetical protein